MDTISSYHIGIALDENGKLLSKFNFPSKEKYKPIKMDFTYCTLLALARISQPKIDPIENIKMEYDDQTNSFYWLITQKIINSKQGINYFNQVLIDASDFTKIKNTKGSVHIVY